MYKNKGSDFQQGMVGSIKYGFSTKMWKHNSAGAWYFVSLPKNLSKEIRAFHKSQEAGWGRMKAIAEIEGHKWETAIWFDTKMDTYILPIKTEIRIKTKIRLNENRAVTIWI